MATKLGKNKSKLHKVQFCTRYGNNFYVYGRVLGVGEFKYANKNFKGAKKVVIATKFRQKSQKRTNFRSVRDTVTIFTHIIGFSGCRIQICYLNFSGRKERCQI